MATASKKATYQAVKDAVGDRWEECLSEYGIPTDKQKRDCPRCGARKFKRSNEGFGCDGCGLKGDMIEYIAECTGQSTIEIKDRLAEKFGVVRSQGKREPFVPTKPKRNPSPLAGKELAPDGYSSHVATFELRSFSDKLASQWVSTKKPVTVDALKLVGATFGKWKQFSKSIDQNVIAIPTYAGPNLDLVNWSMYSATGGMIRSRRQVEKNWQTEEVAKRMAFAGSDRTGIFISLAARELILDGKPIENFRFMKVEGGSDLLAKIDRIPAGENWIVLSSSFGCEWSDSLRWLLPLIEKLKPVECIVIPDCDQAGLDGGIDWARELSAIAPTKILQLPFEIGTKKDIRDFLNAGNGFPELRALMDSTSVFNPDDHPKKKQTKQAVEPVEDTAGEEENESIDQIANFETVISENADGSTSRTDEPIPILEIAQSIFKHSDGWPKRVGGDLFVLQNGESRPLKKPSSLFGWLRESIQVEWKQAPKLPTKDELFEIVWNHCEQFDSVERYPHFPRIDRAYYLCADQPAGTGEFLNRFLEYFSASRIDRELILAAIVTTFWGGPAGGRPAFLITSTHGQGSGKTTLVSLIAKLSGGSIDFDQGCQREEITRRLLSVDFTGRIASLDNIKAQTFSNASYESLITAKSISGHRMYVGNASRPNYFTFFLTVNAPRFSRDMAQRVVQIVLDEPNRSGDWLSDVESFVSENQNEILKDIKAFFERPTTKLSKYSRWGTWQREILSRLNEPERIISKLTSREGECDGDAQMATDLADYCATYLESFGYLSRYCVHVSLETWANITTKAIGQPYRVREASSLFDRLKQSNLLLHMLRNPSKKISRGILIHSIDGKNEEIDYTLDDQIKDRIEFTESAKESRLEQARLSVSGKDAY